MSCNAPIPPIILPNNNPFPGIWKPVLVKKPVIYLYPNQKMEVSLSLSYPGKIRTTYPKAIIEDNTYKWVINAEPDGKLSLNGRTYNYIFWDAENALNFDMTKGFIVEGKQSQEFLENKLAYLGLNSSEMNDFITFWLPELENNAYNLITFQQETYSRSVPLTISPKPDNLIRIFMVFQKLNDPQTVLNIPEPQLQELKRNDLQGFTAVEWGGAQL